MPELERRMQTKTVDELITFLPAVNERLPALARPHGTHPPGAMPIDIGARRNANWTPLQHLSAPAPEHGQSEE